jgi:thiol-disulfide isomerase/thioredoxin
MSRNKKRLPALGLLLLGGALALACQSGPPPRPVAEAPAGSAARTNGGADLHALEQVRDFPIVRTDGSSFRLADLRGKVVVIDFWATWCPPCVAELPSIARLAADPRLKEVAFLCVATDESAETVRDFLRDKDWPMTVLHATSLPNVFTTDGIPATFLIAPDGRTVAMEVGAAAWDDPSAVEYLEKLAKPAAEVKP